MTHVSGSGTTPPVDPGELSALPPAVLDALVEAVVRVDRDGTITLVNARAASMLGATDDDLIGASVFEFLHERNGDRSRVSSVSAAARWMLANGEGTAVHEATLRRQDGSSFKATATLVPLHSDDDVAGGVILLRELPMVAATRPARDATSRSASAVDPRVLLEGITSASAEAVLVLDPITDNAGRLVDLEVRFTNARTEDFTQTRPEDLIGKRIQAVISESRARDLIEQCAAVAAGSAGGDRREFYYEEDGEDRYFHSSAVPFGEGFLVLIRDVTEDRIREARLQASRLQMKRAQDLAHLGNWEWDPQTGELQWSDQLYRIFGCEPGDEISFERYLSLVHPQDRDHVAQCVREALDNRTAFSFEERIIRPDGQERTLSSAGEVLVDEDGYVLLIGVCLDITEIRRAEAAVRESEQRFRQLADQMTDLVSIHDPTGRYVYVSPSVECILALEPPDLIGKQPWEFMHPDDLRRLREADRDLSHVPDGAVVRLRHKSGEWIWLEYLTTIVMTDDGDVLSYQSSARDVTERVKAQQEAARSAAVLAQRNRELQDFAYFASHDLQEPLRKIRAFANLLHEDYGDQLEGEGRFYLERVHDSAHRMSNLISDLLAFSRVSTRSKPYERVDLNQIVDEALSDLEYLIHEAGGTIEVAPLPIIEADPTQMRQLLQNLIGNALKFRKPDVPPLVHVEGQMKRRALHAGTDEQDLLELTVADNGIGFEEKYLSRIFTPFQRLHSGDRIAGTGMGLAICRRIVERHSGMISATSRPGVGSTFTVRLPLKRS